MRWGVPRCEVLIAVGDQRCERVHMVRVLYHWNLIRLEETERGNKTVTALISEQKGSLRIAPQNYSFWSAGSRKQEL